MNTLTIPADDAPLDAIVAFFANADRNGNWPERIAHTDPRVAREGMTDEQAELVKCSPPINAAHVWYDWEGDGWYTDEEVREQMLPILARWREDAATAPVRQCGEMLYLDGKPIGTCAMPHGTEHSHDDAVSDHHRASRS